MPGSHPLTAMLQHTGLDRYWYAFAGFMVLCITLGVYLQMPELMLVPGLLLFAAWTALDIKPIFFLLLCFLPLSFEFQVTESLGTDLPTEPLMLLLAGTIVLKAFYQPDTIRLNHLFDWLLLIHFVWIITTVVFAEIPLVALKFLLAKTWYILAFYTLGRLVLTNPQRWHLAIWLILVPLALTHFIAMVRFREFDFAFADVNRVVVPFYRNHVTFAALAVVVLPYGWYLFRAYKGHWMARSFIFLLLMIILIGVQFSYTRAAYVALVGAILATFLIRFRLMVPAIGVALIIVVAFLSNVVQKNRYLDFAPDYNKTITHQEFTDLLNATYKLQDISTMERVYRWVAAFYMIADRPVTGFGPNNFYENYEQYTVKSFRTYVSDNPEKSGMHNYYLMIAVEQGIVGLLIYFLLMIYVMVRGERIYHETIEPRRKALAMTALASLVVIHLLQTMNDLVETDKVGPFFFLAMALLVMVDQFNQQSRTVALPPSGPYRPQNDAG
jgi:O-antigen ligase